MTIFYDRNNNCALTLNGSGPTTLVGTVYAKDAALLINESLSWSQVDSVLYPKTISLNGNTTFTVNYTKANNYSGTTLAILHR